MLIAVPPVGGDKARRCLVAADRSAPGGIARARRCDRHDQDFVSYLGPHEPVRRWFGGVEERVTGPDVENVLHAQMRVFEQVRGLAVDLERVLLVEGVEIEELSHSLSVYQTTTCG